MLGGVDPDEEASSRGRAVGYLRGVAAHNDVPARGRGSRPILFEAVAQREAAAGRLRVTRRGRDGIEAPVTNVGVDSSRRVNLTPSSGTSGIDRNHRATRRTGIDGDLSAAQ